MSKKPKPNYLLKAKVLKADICKIVKNYDFLDKDKDFIDFIDVEEAYTKVLWKYGLRYVREARKINLASFRKKERLKARISQYMSMGQCIFATLTFTDDVLRDTSEETRRKYVQRFLKSVSDHYVANIDYGVDDKYTHREHYHALILSDFISDKWEYGFTWFERVHRTHSEVTIAKYITKLTNHAIKDSTKRCCYIYSRS